MAGVFRGASRIVAVAMIALLLSCSDAEVSGPDPTDGSVTADIPPTGGSVASGDGAVMVEIPDGAVATTTAITVTPVEDPAPTEGLIAGTAVRLEPSGLVFGTPVQLEIRVDPGSIPAGVPLATLAVHRQSGSGWVRVEGGSVDPARSVVTAPLGSFSVYAVIFLGAPSEVVQEGETQTGEVGQAVAAPPAVVVRSNRGEGLPGLSVTFQVTGGGGSVTGAEQVTTEAGGAQVGSWILGTTAGANTLEATIEGVASPLIFTATAAPGPPSALVKVAGDGQSAPSGGAVATPPVVRAQDEFENPVGGVQVSFSADMGGTVSPTQATTDASGAAAATSWVLGSPGTNTLTAQIPGLPPVHFTAEADVTGTYTLVRVNGAPPPQVGTHPEIVYSATLTLNAGGSCVLTAVLGEVGSDAQEPWTAEQCTYTVDGTAFTLSFYAPDDEATEVGAGTIIDGRITVDLGPIFTLDKN